jgi:hypothetical protein
MATSLSGCKERICKLQPALERVASLAQLKHRKVDFRSQMWNIRSLYTIGSLKTVKRELGKYKLDLVAIQEVRWEKGHWTGRRFYIFLWTGQWRSSARDRFFVHKRIVSAVRRVEFISDRMSYIILRGCWCNIIVLNVHAPCEDEGSDVKDSFCEELGRVFGQFRRYIWKFCSVISVRM